MNGYILTLVFLFVSFIGVSQNLINNGNFEEFKEDSMSRTINDLKGDWVCLKSGGLSGNNGKWVFNYCSDLDECINRGYGSLWYYLSWYPSIIGDVPSDNGLFQTELKVPLKKDSTYLIEFYLKFRLNDHKDHSSDERIVPCSCFAFAISPVNLLEYFKISELSGFVYLPHAYKYEEVFIPDFWIPKGTMIKDCIDWKKFSFTFCAKGGEKYFQFGSYDTKGFDLYIGIDDISIKKLSLNEANESN